MGRKKVVITKHHRNPRSRGGTSNVKNISLVDYDDHVAWHKLFDNYSPETICRMINDVWLDPRYEFIVQKRQRKK